MGIGKGMEVVMANLRHYPSICWKEWGKPQKASVMLAGLQDENPPWISKIWRNANQSTAIFRGTICNMFQNTKYHSSGGPPTTHTHKMHYQW